VDADVAGGGRPLCGFDPSVIAEALRLKPSTVKRCIYLKGAQKGAEGGGSDAQPQAVPQHSAELMLPTSVAQLPAGRIVENLWISLIRLKRQHYLKLTNQV